MSAKTCSTTAWSRCCPSAWTSSNGESVNTAWWRQAGNSSSCPAPACLFRSRTRRTTSRAVTAWPFFDANAVYPVSATSASEIQAPSWSSQMARGYRIGVQAPSGMAAIAARMLAFAGTVTENRAPPRRIAPITAAL